MPGSLATLPGASPLAEQHDVFAGADSPSASAKEKASCRGSTATISVASSGKLPHEVCMSLNGVLVALQYGFAQLQCSDGNNHRAVDQNSITLKLFDFSCG
jgi:hypothetical protein